uniref:Scm-like with four MBT domains protein 1 n=1 Tax=Aceria tosichella TaxID=561515 RepID=A0A6G1SIG8_9ACAR
MDLTTNDCNEPSVDEGAFWHTNMDLYYGYLAGEVVEVEHEPNKYWLALIQYCFKHLVLLKWVGNYGSEFWVDTSMTNTATSSSGTLNEFNNPKRLFPLGYHLQSQLKSQFTLEKPSRILVKPSLYNPSKDPYADIRTIDDLLLHDFDDLNNDDTFAIKSTSDTASLALAKCKTKINYGQEDQDELEAALQSLTGLEQYDESTGRAETGDQEQAGQLDEFAISKESKDKSSSDTNGQIVTNSKILATTDPLGVQNHSSVISSEPIDDISKHKRGDKRVGHEANDDLKLAKAKDTTTDQNDPSANVNNQDKNDDPKFDINALELCKKLQASAINKGRYLGVHPTSNEHNDEVFFSKPKQFFDVGGANHERLFVTGTILEVYHTEENDSGQLDLWLWFAYVVKNVGGRLTLRWFLCDEPKFKQGRLEMKSSRSRFVLEESDQPIDGDNSSDGDSSKIVSNIDSTTFTTGKQNAISSKSITFSMHFCDPKIQTISQPHTKTTDRKYKLPCNISAHLIDSHGKEFLHSIEDSQMDHVFDARRMNLDRDRPLIDHILSAVRFNAPTYLDLIFAPNDKDSKRDVLMSCPKITKLLRASVKRELGPGVFEIHSEPLSETDEIIKIIYPYDSSYAILPLDWANNNGDCLSINPSRNTSPMIPAETNDELAPKNLKLDQKPDKEADVEMEKVQNSTTNSNDQPSETSNSDTNENPRKEKEHSSTVEQCLRESRSKYTRIGGSFKMVTGLKEFNSTEIEEIVDFDELDPTCWTRVLRNRELRAPTFHCCIDYSQKEVVESRFKVMDSLEVVHPSSDSIICMGRIRKVVFPLIWIQLSTDCYTLVPFNSTNIYPTRWCETHNHKLISLLPPRKRCIPRTSSQQNSDMKRRKKAKISDDNNLIDSKDQKLVSFSSNEFYEKEHFDLGALNDRQAGIDYILNEKSAYIKIFFNHKCFTGPSLSKSKICSLPQYVGPGPMRLVVEEVVTKVISVAYVPPRILNDLSSKSFEELLIERNLTNTVAVEFKAKYQKRVHRDTIPVCVNPDDVALYCECICEHIKCCYNLFGLSLYDGDDCPSHCRSLTKSNKFMKRATYYREKARQGEFLNQNTSENNNNNKKASSTTGADSNLSSGATSRAKYTGRGSSESNSSSNMSCSDQANSRTSPSLGRSTSSTGEMKENSISPDAWTIDDVARYLDGCQLSIFKSYMRSEGIDGQALLLLDKATIEEHFQRQLKTEITQEEVNKLCQLVELIKARV